MIRDEDVKELKIYMKKVKADKETAHKDWQDYLMDAINGPGVLRIAYPSELCSCELKI